MCHSIADMALSYRSSYCSAIAVQHAVQNVEYLPHQVTLDRGDALVAKALGSFVAASHSLVACSCWVCWRWQKVEP